MTETFFLSNFVKQMNSDHPHYYEAETVLLITIRDAQGLGTVFDGSTKNRCTVQWVPCSPQRAKPCMVTCPLAAKMRPGCGSTDADVWD